MMISQCCASSIMGNNKRLLYYVRVFYNITISIELDKKSLTKDEIGNIIMSNRLDKEIDHMGIPKIFESEYRFCKIVWKHEPIKSGSLSKLCAEELGWKNSTTYTVIKRLSERGVIKNENSTVTSLVKENEAREAEIEELLENKFDGSCPDFLAAFIRKGKLSDKDIEELQTMIDNLKAQ